MHRTHAVARPNLRKVIAVATATLIAVSLAVVPSANAGTSIAELNVTLSEDATAETFDVELDFAFEGYSCATTDYTLTDAGSDEEFDVEVVDGEDNLTGTFAADHLDPGDYDLEVLCTVDPDDGEPFEASFNDVFAFSRVTVDKQVEGEVPEDTTFLVRAACEVVTDAGAESGESWNVDVDFDREGGTQNFLVEFVQDGPSILCIVSEPEDGGADSTEFENTELAMDGPSSETTTVTNTFPEPEPEPEPEEEAEPAEPVEDEPDFTG